LALQLARAAGFDEAACDVVREASLLRWSGCTANADGFADALGDDVAGREAMLAGKPDWAKAINERGGANVVITPLAQIHCEVSGEVARLLELARETERTLRHMFETWDGTGLPGGLSGAAVPESVFAIWLAGDLEIFSRLYGLETALTMIERRADARYPAALAALLTQHAAAWLAELEGLGISDFDTVLSTARMDATAPLELVADVIDLKLPWMTGFSRAVAASAAQCAVTVGLDREAQALIYRAGLIHGIGRSAVSNSLWNAQTRLSSGAWEKLRLVPYWTSRAGKQTGTLAEAAELASHAYERLDGSGYFRGASGHALSTSARVLGTSLAWVALRAARPWREALSDTEAKDVLIREADAGRYDREIVEALTRPNHTHTRARAIQPRQASVRLSVREIEVLGLISHGASNKEVALALSLSPSTVRTHVESVFRKLECSTRAAATLKASALGWL
jgi:HD-GYP domain-containing protein (c-di-GMP phosphodiesterase class II)